MSTDVLILKRGDTGPMFRAQCLDGTSGVDLSGATASRLLMSGPVTQTLTLTRESGTSGWVRRTWAANDLTTVGTYKAEVEVTWADGTVQTFPGSGFVGIVVTEDLG